MTDLSLLVFADEMRHVTLRAAGARTPTAEELSDAD